MAAGSGAGNKTTHVLARGCHQNKHCLQTSVKIMKTVRNLNYGMHACRLKAGSQHMMQGLALRCAVLASCAKCCITNA